VTALGGRLLGHVATSALSVTMSDSRYVAAAMTSSCRHFAGRAVRQHFALGCIREWGGPKIRSVHHQTVSLIEPNVLVGSAGFGEPSSPGGP
jgi:hypothetical protein